MLIAIEVVGNHIIYLEAKIKINETNSEEADKSGPTTNFFFITEEIIWYLTFCQSTENKKCDIINFLKEQKTIAIHTDLSTQAISN